MIALLLVALTQPKGYGGIRIVTLRERSTRVESYPVRSARNGGLELGPPSVRNVGAGKSVLALVPSPDGRRLAAIVASAAPAATRIYVLDSGSLEARSDLRAPAAVQVQWSPKGDRLAFSDGEGTGAIVSADGRRAVSYDRVSDVLWSPEGGTAYVRRGADGVRRWYRIAAWAKPVAVDERTATRETLLSSGQSLLDLNGYGPFVVPSPNGTVLVDVNHRTGRPVEDVVIRGGRRRRIGRSTAFPNPSQSVLWDGPNRLVYAQNFHLFDERAAPDGSIWLGSLDLKTGRRTQAPLRLPPDFDPDRMRLARSD